MSLTTASTWSTDNTRWQSFYSNTITQQIDHLISLIEKKKKTPDALIRHFDSMLAVFEQGISHPDSTTRLKLINFVRTLHPLPLWWGKWSEWMRIIDQVRIVAEKADKFDKLIWLDITQSEMLIIGGDAGKALLLAEKALFLAKSHHNFKMIFKAEMAVFEARKDIGSIGDRIDAIAKLEKSLLAKKTHLSKEVFQVLEVEFLLKKTDVLRRMKRKSDAFIAIQRAHAIATASLDENSPLVAQLYNRRGATYWTAEKNDLAIADFEKATKIFKNLGDKASQVYSIGYTGLIAWSAGEYRQAEKMLQNSINFAEKIKALQWQAIQTGNLGLVSFTRGRLSQAIALMEQHHILSQLINNHAERKRAIGNIGYVQIYLGNFQNAYQRLTHDITYTKKMQFQVGAGTTYANMAWVMEGLGDIDSALEYAEKSLSIAKKTNAHLLKIIALRSMSELQKDSNAKAYYAEEAYALAKKHSRRFNKAGALLTLADCYQDKNLHDKARQILDELGSTDWLKVPTVFKTLRLPLLYWG